MGFNCHLRTSTIAFTCMLLLASCSPVKEDLSSAKIKELTQQDFATIYKDYDSKQALTLEQALARALRYNLDTKVAEYDALIASSDADLERMGILPSIKADYRYITRNNPGASSSLSVLTGVQSLEPSISTEQSRFAGSLEATWNVLDASLAIARSRSADNNTQIAEERQRKIYHNVVRDVYSAYWRAAIAQASTPVVTYLLERIDMHLALLKQVEDEGVMPFGQIKELRGQLLGKQTQLFRAKEHFMLSELELKTLISLPPGQPLILDVKDNEDFSSRDLPQIKQNIKSLEEMALSQRPEVREDILNKKISTRNIKMTVWETFPGAEIVLGANNDQNRFLVDNNWLSLTASVTQSITKLLTLPKRKQRAENQDVLADKKRQALLAAILAQVHISKKRLDFVSTLYDGAEKAEKNQKKYLSRAKTYQEAGVMGGSELLNVELDAGISYMNKLSAFAEAQTAYAQILNTLGFDIWQDVTPDMNLDQMAVILKKNIHTFDQEMSG